MALAWLLGQGENIIPIPGTKKPKVSGLRRNYVQMLNFPLQYLQENVGALRVQLSQDELMQIRELAEKANAPDLPRFPAWYTAESFANTPPL